MLGKASERGGKVSTTEWWSTVERGGIAPEED